MFEIMDKDADAAALFLGRQHPAHLDLAVAFSEHRRAGERIGEKRLANAFVDKWSGHLRDIDIAKWWPDMDTPEGRAEIRRQFNELIRVAFDG